MSLPSHTRGVAGMRGGTFPIRSAQITSPWGEVGPLAGPGEGQDHSETARRNSGSLLNGIHSVPHSSNAKSGRVALGDCSPRAPTDPYVRFYAYGSSRRYIAVPHTICWPRGDTLRGSVSPAWCRPSFHDAAPPSLHGVREGPFPRFDATMRRSDSLPSVSPHFVSFAWRYHSLRPLFVPSGPGHGAVDHPGVGSRVSSRRVDGGGRVSQVPGEP